MSDSSDPSKLDVLDFTGDDSGGLPATVSPQAGAAYDPRPQEDGARRTIAYLLIGLLWLMVGSLFVLLACETITAAEVKDFAVLLGPVVTLVSAATGFYYGTKTAPAGGSGSG